MEIISGGIYLRKRYLCDRCCCVFEIESKDIKFEKHKNYTLFMPTDSTITLYVKCPECKNKVIVDEVKE